VLGEDPADGRWTDVERHPDNEQIEGTCRSSGMRWYGGISGASDPEGGSCVPPAAVAATAIAAPRRLLARHQDRCEEEAPHNTLPSNATLLPMRRRGGMNEETKSSIALIFQAVEILTECPSRSSAMSAYRVNDP
jgi:hypothetical protein